MDTPSGPHPGDGPDGCGELGAARPVALAGESAGVGVSPPAVPARVPFGAASGGWGASPSRPARRARRGPSPDAQAGRSGAARPRRRGSRGLAPGRYLTE